MRIKGIGIDRASAPKINAVGGCDANEDEGGTAILAAWNQYFIFLVQFTRCGRDLQQALHAGRDLEQVREAASLLHLRGKQGIRTRHDFGACTL